MDKETVEVLILGAFLIGVASGERGAVGFNPERDEWVNYQTAHNVVELMFTVETFACMVWEIDE